MWEMGAMDALAVLGASEFAYASEEEGCIVEVEVVVETANIGTTATVENPAEEGTMPTRKAGEEEHNQDPGFAIPWVHKMAMR